MKKTALILFALCLCVFAVSCAGGNGTETSSPDHGHIHSYTAATVTADCVTGGYTLYRCSCGSEYTADNVPALGHDYYSEKTEPACGRDGREIFTCRRCGDTYAVVLPAPEHRVENGTYALEDRGDSTALTLTGKCMSCGNTVTVTRCSVRRGILASADDASPALEAEGGNVDVRLNADNTLTVYARPYQYMEFVRWSDGSTDRRRKYGGEGELYALFAFDSKLPVINVTTDSGGAVTSRDEYYSCSISVTGSDGYDFIKKKAGIRVRGNASSMYGDESWIRNNKVHYRIKFDARTQMLGLNGDAACKSWVLLRGDGCYLKDTISFYTFRNLCDKDVFCPDLTYATLFINGAYMGVYEVCDQVQIDKYRVDIPEQNYGETDIATGYLMELENYANTAPNVFSVGYDGVKLTDMYGVRHTARSVNVSVKYDDMSSEQLEFLKKYLTNVYRIVYRAIFDGAYYKLNAACDLVGAPEFKTAGECIANVIDLDAAAAMYITEELAAERDVGIGSFFMYTDLTLEQPLLTFCAPWDFSWAFGTDTGFAIDHFWVSAWQPEEFISYAGNRSSTWFITLYQCEEFREIVKQKWRRFRSDGAFDTLIATLPRFAEEYADDIINERKRWETGDPAVSAANLAAYLLERAAWLDTQWGE